MLNGETPVEGSYLSHVISQLDEDDDDSDSDDDTSNAHENVRKDSLVLFRIMSDSIASRHSVRLSPAQEFLSPLVLIMT